MTINELKNKLINLNDKIQFAKQRALNQLQEDDHNKSYEVTTQNPNAFISNNANNITVEEVQTNQINQEVNEENKSNISAITPRKNLMPNVKGPASKIKSSQNLLG